MAGSTNVATIWDYFSTQDLLLIVVYHWFGEHHEKNGEKIDGVVTMVQPHWVILDTDVRNQHLGTPCIPIAVQFPHSSKCSMCRKNITYVKKKYATFVGWNIVLVKSMH